MKNNLPDVNTMYEAILRGDTRFEGIFFVAVKTTGIFCRPTCSARKPKKENVEFFRTVKESLSRGYRPCKKCRPMEPRGETPDWLKPVMKEIERKPDILLRDKDLRQRGLQPSRVRRWFKQYHNITFQTYLRLLRIGQAYGRIRHGIGVADTAFNSGYDSLSGFTSSFKKVTGFNPIDSSGRQLITVTRILTPLGPMLAGVFQDHLCLLEFIDRRMLETQIARIKRIYNTEVIPGEHPLFGQLTEQLVEYFEGHRIKFTVPLSLQGTSFQMRVWSELLVIPYGETRTYSDQAENIGNRAAMRAVGRANGDNRIAIVVPCHRVIGKNGELVGYGGGLERKQYLLNIESSKTNQRDN